MGPRWRRPTRWWSFSLLVKALRQAAAFADTIGIAAVEVDAFDDEARSFCLKYGFTSLEDDQRHLYLTMQAVRQLTP